MSASSVVLLPYAPSSVAVARQILSAELLSKGTFADAVDDAVLVVSELLSNSLRHAHPLPSGQLRVAWETDGEHIEVEVSDGGATTEPRAGRASRSALGGRGLGIVEYLAERWGVRREGEETTVWAVLECPKSSPDGQLASSEMADWHDYEAI